MLTTCSKTDIGRLRSLNQDTVYSCNVPVGKLDNLFIVADGMGGHKAGDYASAYTVNAIERVVMESFEQGPIRILTQAIETANREVFTKAITETDFQGMGTTVVAATVENNTLYVGNVGDSRLYVLNDEITQITRDHSLVEEMIRIGELDKSAARNHPEKNIITRAIGVERNVKIDFFEVDLNEGDIFLLCTDGLTNMVDDQEILRIVKSHENVREMAVNLIDRANDNGGKDNIGIVIGRFEGVK